MDEQRVASSNTIFYSYAHEDEDFVRELEKNLSLLKRQGLITAWYDRKIIPGTDWASEIDSHLMTASLILFLISADFLASDYAYSIEVMQALQRHERGEARVIPIILRPVDWRASPVGKLQALPRDAKAVTRWANSDEAFFDIARGIRLALQDLQTPQIVPHDFPRIDEQRAVSPNSPRIDEQRVASSNTIFYSYAHEDEVFARELEKNLSLLKWQGLITAWYDRKIIPGTDWASEIDSHLMTASLILFLISADFLASDYAYGIEVMQALQRHERSEARVIPIILRPVDWQGSPFDKLQALPSDARPITVWPDWDVAFFNVSQGIRRVIEDLQLPQISQHYQIEKPSVQKIDSLPPSRSYPVYDVFMKSGVPKVTFVEREDFGLLKLSLAQPGRGVVIEGPSGVGKTTAIEKAVEELRSDLRTSGVGTTVQILSARNPEHLNRIQTLYKWHNGTVIVDDFHRLDSKLRQDLVDYLKYLADTEPESKKIVIVGIPRTGQALVDTSFDIATRIDVFKLGLVKDELIIRMIEQGEEALNIKFDRKTEIALAASGSLNIAQFLCFNICIREQITNTEEQLRLVHYDINAAVSDVMTELTRKFGEPIRRFAAMGGQSDSTSLLLLEELVKTEDGFLSLSLLKGRKSDLVQSVEKFINERWMNKLYDECPGCAIHFFFDPLSQVLVIDDPQLAFYLKKLRFSALAREAGKISTLAQRKVFISYSHKDARWLKRLQVHLKPIEREGLIDLWDDTKIAAGVQWKGAIQEALETARVAVVLVSADFLASDFISEHELPTLLGRAASSGTVIIPVIVSPCLFSGTELSAFQAVNSPDRPLSAMVASEREQIFVNVAEAIKNRLTI